MSEDLKVLNISDHLTTDPIVRNFAAVLSAGAHLRQILMAALPHLHRDQQKFLVTMVAFRMMGAALPASLELIRRLPTFAGQKTQDIDAAVNALIDEGVVEFIAKGDGHFIWPALEGAMETALEAANAPALVDLQGKPLY